MQLAGREADSDAAHHHSCEASLISGITPKAFLYLLNHISKLKRSQLCSATAGAASDQPWWCPSASPTLNIPACSEREIKKAVLHYSFCCLKKEDCSLKKEYWSIDIDTEGWVYSFSYTYILYREVLPDLSYSSCSKDWVVAQYSGAASWTIPRARGALPDFTFWVLSRNGPACHYSAILLVLH